MNLFHCLSRITVRTPFSDRLLLSEVNSPTQVNIRLCTLRTPTEVVVLLDITRAAYDVSTLPHSCEKTNVKQDCNIVCSSFAPLKFNALVIVAPITNIRPYARSDWSRSRLKEADLLPSAFHILLAPLSTRCTPCYEYLIYMKTSDLRRLHKYRLF